MNKASYNIQLELNKRNSSNNRLVEFNGLCSLIGDYSKELTCKDVFCRKEFNASYSSFCATSYSLNRKIDRKNIFKYLKGINKVASEIDRIDAQLSTFSLNTDFFNWNTLSKDTELKTTNEISHLIIKDTKFVSFVENTLKKDFDEFKENFASLLKVVSQSSEGIDSLETYFIEMIDINRIGSLDFIQSLYLKSIEKSELDVPYIMKIIRLIQRFDYDMLFPYSQLIVATAIHIVEPSLQLEALKVIDRWADERAFVLLSNMNPPENPWVKMKYISLLKTFKNDICKGY